jgi:hypothetical protein
MDADRFDALSRSFTTVGSRRRALALALSAALGPLLVREDTAAHNALLKCKRLKGEKKKKCVKKAKKHNLTHPPSPACTRNCGGKTCGDDGCGGSCGTCSFGSCNGNTCVCPNGTELCRGQCEDLCGPGQIHNTETCQCCGANGTTGCSNVGGNDFCCSHSCAPASFTIPSSCIGQPLGVPCDFNGVCRSDVCTNDVCSCKHKGSSCTGGGCTCCCSNSCDPGGLCTGLASGDKCTADAQCESGNCAPNCSDSQICTEQKFCQPA